MNVGKCAVFNCGNKSITKNYCAKHYRKFLIYGDPLIQTRASSYGEGIQWLKSHINYTNKDDCLIWSFTRDRHGRGQVSFNGKMWQTHRLMCVWVHGEPPFEKACATHNCGKGHDGCVNPNHLVWKDQLGNMLDRAIHNTIAKGSKQGNSILTEKDVFEIRELRGYYSGAELSRMYKISPSSISLIQNNKSWI